MNKFVYICTVQYKNRTIVSAQSVEDKSKAVATVNFLYRSTKAQAPLNIRLLHRFFDDSEPKGYRDLILGTKTKLSVSKHYWNQQHNLKRVKDIEISNKQTEINTELNQIERYVLRLFNALNSVESTIISKDWLKTVIESYYNPDDITASIPKDLLGYIDYYIEDMKHDFSRASVAKLNVVKNKMQRLQEKRGKIIMISEIGGNFKNEFAEYYKVEKYSQNTAHRELGTIKTFCKHARSKGVQIHHELDDLMLKKKSVKNVYLTFDELKKIEDATMNHEHQDNARDWLIISCYTGQRISDFMRFNSNMMRIEKGKSLLEFKQKKTQKLMTIPLHQKVLEILEKRNGEFPRSISDQRYNDYIKEVCELAGLNELIEGKRSKNISKDKKVSKIRSVSGTFEKWELVSSHIGRRSFATNFYGQIPTNYLIYVTGHSSESLFLQYVGKSNKDLALELLNYF